MQRSQISQLGAPPCAYARDAAMNAFHGDSRRNIRTIARCRTGRTGRHCGGTSRQILQDHPRGRRCVVPDRARQHHRPAWRQWRRQDHHHCHDHGAGAADLRPHPGARPSDPRRERRGAGADEFRKSLCGHADAADGAAKPHHLRPALCGAAFARTHRGAGLRSRSRRFPRPRQRKAFSRTEDPRGAGKSADQPAGVITARRADGFARPRYRRLGPPAPRPLLQGARRHHPPGVAQHARGRASVRPRHHHEARKDRGRRHARADSEALQPRDAGRSVSGRRARPGPGEREMSELTLREGGIALHRINAMVLRYWYLLQSSWPRLLELIYWPALQIITWGFLQSYIAQNDSFFARAGGTLIGAVILWDILFRGQLGFSISFLEEMWARNLGNLMMSPLKPIELLISLMVMSLVRLAIGVIPMTLLALFFFDFNFYSIGLPLIAFFCNLIFFSWSLGIFVSGLVLRNGLGAESIVWTMMFAVMPLACIYYPVSVLPHWLQYVAWALPPTYVFEGMRALLTDHVFRADLMLDSLLINAVLFVASFLIFLALLRSAKRHGSLLGGGE